MIMRENKESIVYLYLQSKWKTILLLGIVFICFTIVFLLNDLPLSPILYAFILCLYIIVIFFVIDFFQFRKKYRLLAAAKNTVTVHLDGLPVPSERTEQLYQEIIQLLFQHKNDLTLQADHTRTDLIDYFSQWTHQIKTPIAAMRLLLQSKKEIDHKQLEIELFKIEQYVEFVLQYIRLDNLSNDLVIKTYALDDIVKQAVRKYAKIFIKKKISLELAPLNCNVLTDKKWLSFVLEQIISNALKYTDEGTISIYMKDDTKILVIEDTGMGIQEEDLPRIFEKGFTGYNGRAFKQSTGIGLYLCKQIVEKLSHHISVTSKVGEGTKVMIDFEMKDILVE